MDTKKKVVMDAKKVKVYATIDATVIVEIEVSQWEEIEVLACDVAEKALEQLNLSKPLCDICIFPEVLAVYDARNEEEIFDLRGR